MPQSHEAPAWRVIGHTCGHVRNDREDTIPELVQPTNPHGTAYLVRVLAHLHLHPPRNERRYRPRHSESPLISGYCAHCGKLFSYRRAGRSGKRVYCSEACAQAAVKRRAVLAYRARMEREV